MIQTRIVEDLSAWDRLVESSPFSPMTQAGAYGKFYETMKEPFFVIGSFEGERLIGGALVIVVRAKRGSYFYLPYGPLAAHEKDFSTVLVSCTEFLKKAAKEQHVACIRISPFITTSEERKQELQTLGYSKAPIHALAETTCLLNVEESEEILLAQMNKNHRNLIRRCEKEGIIIKSYTSADKLAEFHKLHSITAKRHQFVRFSDEYVEHEFKAFEKQNQAVVFYAYLPDGTLDSGAVVYYYGNTAAYRHGASLGQNNKIPTPYLIQWSAIKEAKKRGKSWYNFWGVAPDNAKKSHPFKGITHFKKGFGGEIKDLLECHDLIIDMMRYWPMWIIETMRRIKRGF